MTDFKRDPEVEEGFRLWYGNNTDRYPTINAYNNPEFYRRVKRDFDTEQENLNRKKEIKFQIPPIFQLRLAAKYMANEYIAMKGHKYKYLDDYHHCKANYNATKLGEYGEATAQKLGFIKELFDKVKNYGYKGLSERETEDDFRHDLYINALGRAKAKYKDYPSDMDACAEFREKNPDFPEEYW